MDKLVSPQITLNVNGEDCVVEPEAEATLLDVLREDLDLTGAKKACDDGECGSCFVMLGDKAVKACLLKAERGQAKPIVTIEGLAAQSPEQALVDGPAGERMHALQRAFLEKGATQCGFCIPGMIVKANTLLIKNPDPSREEVIGSLSTNLCRCTGYYKIIEAVLHAADMLRDGAAPLSDAGDPDIAVGESVARLDSPDTVNGRAKYAADLKRDGMLHAKLLRAPHHHARILSIDTSEAEKVPGVAAVVTATDVPGTPWLSNCQPQPFVFPADKVRFLGEAVAAVAAESETIAEQAAALIKVEYEPLPHVFKLADAAAEDAPRLFDQAPNVSPPQAIDVGDVEDAFAKADIVIENDYSIPMREHAAMEPEAALAHIDDDGFMVIESPLYHPFVQGQESVAANLDWDFDKVRIVCPAMGGNFGTRGDTLVPVVAGLLTIKTGRPVRLVQTRAESVLTSCKAPSVDIRYKTGATRDGRVIAIDVEVLHAAGAWGPALIPTTTQGVELCCFETLGALVSHITGPYEIANVRARAYDVLVNAPRNVPLRGTNANYLPLAYESQMDLLAETLGLEPLEVRRRNAVRVGSMSHVGQELVESINLLEEIETVQPYYRAAVRRAAAADLSAPWKRGVGVGCGWRNIGYVNTDVSAGAELTEDGRIVALAGTVEQGQGATTQFAQIMADAVGVPVSNVDVLIGDTYLAPYPVPTFSSITTVATGKAVQKAGDGLRAAILKLAALHLNVGEDEVEIVGTAVKARRDPDARISLAEVARLMRERDQPTRYEGEISWDGEAPNILYGFSTGLIELDVNEETGEVRLLNHVNACDPGTVVNPLALEGQVDGAVAFGVGFALSEAFDPDNPPTLKGYGLSTTKDMPDSITRLFVGDKLERGPFGAKSAGEIPGISPIPAIVNAIANATGARVRDIPATPERVLAALQQTTESNRAG